MKRIFGAAAKYVQGAGVIDELGHYLRETGQRPVIVIDHQIRELLSERLEKTLNDATLPVKLISFPGEVTHAVIDSLADLARMADADVIVGVGGGKALDAAKGVALKLGTRFVSVPTIASTDGPASAAIAVYNDQHVMVEVLKLPRNPELVLVDSQVIIAAPIRFLLAGVGDAIAKKFEAEACALAGKETPQGTLSTHSGLAAADTCYRLIRTHAIAALQAAKLGQVTEDVEALIEAAVLLSTLGFENGGLSIAHAIARGFPYMEWAVRTLHGEHVAYGLLVQLVLEDRSLEFCSELYSFYGQIGLPRRLADLGLENTSVSEIETLTEHALVSPSIKRFRVEVTSQAIIQAINRVESWAPQA
ncbi:glycerol dehydrogenase [Pseudomonas sp. BF-R-19]|uniref:glycerol dehydrogenase n=1 Tax=Pseudomonas sp. BF-R-19 TaxID=2832397 RepID=UPI001CBA992C|nr:glycerol dehydrogenase [Pseudomonas sp. BF-R-19]